MLIRKESMKYFLSGILSLMVCLSAHAAKSVIYYEDSVIVGKEYLVVAGSSENKDSLQIKNSQSEISLNDFSCVYVAENAKLCGEEHFYAKPDTRQIAAKKNVNAKTKPDESVKNDNAEKAEPEIVVVPDFPLDPASLSYSYSSKESAVPVSQQRIHDEQAATSKVQRENAYPGFENSSLSLYFPEQRHKLSIAATQCGILTSFAPNSPSL